MFDDRVTGFPANGPVGAVGEVLIRRASWSPMSGGEPEAKPTSLGLIQGDALMFFF